MVEMWVLVLATLLVSRVASVREDSLLGLTTGTVVDAHPCRFLPSTRCYALVRTHTPSPRSIPPTFKPFFFFFFFSFSDTSSLVTTLSLQRLCSPFRVGVAG
jgi:hypothetical protein